MLRQNSLGSACPRTVRKQMLLPHLGLLQDSVGPNPSPLRLWRSPQYGPEPVAAADFRSWGLCCFPCTSRRGHLWFWIAFCTDSQARGRLCVASRGLGRTEVPGQDLEKFFQFLSPSFLFLKVNLTYLVGKPGGLNREASVTCLVQSASWCVFSTCSSLPLPSCVTLPCHLTPHPGEELWG